VPELVIHALDIEENLFPYFLKLDSRLFNVQTKSLPQLFENLQQPAVALF